MASFFGPLHRPLSAGLFAAVAAVTAELSDKLTSFSPVEPAPSVSPPTSILVQEHTLNSLGSHLDDGLHRRNSSLFHVLDSVFRRPINGSVASPTMLLSAYQYARLVKPTKQLSHFMLLNPHSLHEEVMYRWHLPSLGADNEPGKSSCLKEKSQMVVVLLGWLGAKQRHMKKYAEWYNSRGFHVITFTFPMADVLSYKSGGRAEQIIDSLATHLADCVAEQDEKKLIFHTFSNTGWLTYGVLLERFRNQDPSLLEKIKGCVIDSAPVAAPDPQVWASGFSAAFLKKQSVATKGALISNDSSINNTLLPESDLLPEPAVVETAILVILESFFKVVLNLPNIRRRLSDVLGVLSSDQPKCPQLYIYSSADRVIPVKSVESFLETQKKAGHAVRACNFISSPHVDHFRSQQVLYTSQIICFLEELVLNCCKGCS